jgi:tetratricopeptide (TPR) repeat protein
MQDRQAAIIKAAIADKRYDIALEAARNNPNLLRIAAPLSLEKGLVKEVLSAARRTKPEERAGVLAAIALKLEQIGKLAQAKPVWSEAITAAQQIKDGPERAEALMAVSLKLRQTTHQSDLNTLLQQIIVIDKAYRNDTSYPWNQIIEEETESSLRYKDPILAMRLVEVMEPDAHREQNRILLFQNLLSFFDEHIPEAETVLAKMPQSVFKVRSQIALADAYFTWGQFQKSSVALKQALTDLRQVQDAEIEKAHRTFSDYSVGDRNTAPWLTKKDSRSSLLGYIALGHTKIQDRHSATQVLQSIPNPQIQHQWRSHLACYSQNYQK